MGQQFSAALFDFLPQLALRRTVYSRYL